MIISTFVSSAISIFFLDKRTINSCHDETNLRRICSAGEMGVNLLSFVLVQGDEAVQNVIASQGIVLSALVIREVVLHWADGQLLLEAIDLVKEQDDGSLYKPSRIADGIKQGEGLLHTVDGLVLE